MRSYLLSDDTRRKRSSRVPYARLHKNIKGLFFFRFKRAGQVDHSPMIRKFKKESPPCAKSHELPRPHFPLTTTVSPRNESFFYIFSRIVPPSSSSSSCSFSRSFSSLTRLSDIPREEVRKKRRIRRSLSEMRSRSRIERNQQKKDEFVCEMYNFVYLLRLIITVLSRTIAKGSENTCTCIYIHMPVCVCIYISI